MGVRSSPRTRRARYDDYEASLNLFARLHQFGLTSQAPEVTRILEVASKLVISGVPSSEVEQSLAQRPKTSPE
jgi:hypothetical protein